MTEIVKKIKELVEHLESEREEWQIEFDNYTWGDERDEIIKEIFKEHGFEEVEDTVLEKHYKETTNGFEIVKEVFLDMKENRIVTKGILEWLKDNGFKRYDMVELFDYDYGRDTLLIYVKENVVYAVVEYEHCGCYDTELKFYDFLGAFRLPK